MFEVDKGVTTMLKRFKLSYLHILTAINLILKWTFYPDMSYTHAFMPSIIAIVVPTVFVLILLSVMLYFKCKRGLSVTKQVKMIVAVMSKHKQLKREGYTNEEIKVMMRADIEREKLGGDAVDVNTRTNKSFL